MNSKAMRLEQNTLRVFKCACRQNRLEIAEYCCAHSKFWTENRAFKSILGAIAP